MAKEKKIVITSNPEKQVITFPSTEREKKVVNNTNSVSGTPFGAPEIRIRGNKIKEIIELFHQGKTKQEIIDLGYHKGTVSIQIAKILAERKSRNGRERF